MSWEERYGGIWISPEPGEVTVVERHLANRNLVAHIARRNDGLFRAAVLRPYPDPQWRLPFWGEVERAALVASIDEGERYLTTLLARLDAPDHPIDYD